MTSGSSTPINSPPPVFVTDSVGPVGANPVRRLLDDGVRVLLRHEDNNGGLDDLDDPSAPSDLHAPGLYKQRRRSPTPPIPYAAEAVD